MVLYWIGYIITFFILYNCSSRGIGTPLMTYLHDMGVTTPFKCTNRGLISALLQSIIWPWPFFMITLIIVISPLLFIYALFKK